MPANLKISKDTPWVAAEARRDALVIGLSCLLTYYLAGRHDWFEQFYAFSKVHAPWHLDQLALILVNLTLGGFYFAYKRFREIEREIKRRTDAERRLQFLALNDPLTGLSNRRHFQLLFEQSLSDLRLPRREDVAVILIDLDRFKPVNDLHGHATGDKLLQAVSTRMREVVRDSECLARLGGDEFAVLVKQVACSDDLARIATRILKALEAPFAIEQVECRISCSIGIAIGHPRDPVTAEELMKRADLALYRAKSEGRSQYRYFEADMDMKVRERSRLELELRAAIKDRAIAPYYQPLVRLSDGQVEGYEVLARWRHPKDGLVPPETFIPIAEDTGLIGELTLHLLDQACIDALDWAPETYVSINISPVQLRDPGLCDRLLEALNRHGFDPRRLEVEITENALIHDLDMARKVLFDLRNAGISIALDDFGTGYSSLHHLRELPFHKLKIDRSFILGMSFNDESRKIVDAIIALGRSLGLKTTAEGIETAENAYWLTEIGCLTGQGYLFGRPMQADQIGSDLEASRQAEALRTIADLMRARLPEEKAIPERAAISDADGPRAMGAL